MRRVRTNIVVWRGDRGSWETSQAFVAPLIQEPNLLESDRFLNSPDWTALSGNHGVGVFGQHGLTKGCSRGALGDEGRLPR
jgi:hypothetical protein